jgi:hypothetical protein
LTPGALNCSQCEKCARTIVSLVVGGVDPESCGFKVTLETVAYMKQRLQSGTIAKSHLALWWGPAQREIPEQLEGDMYGLREFLEWFRDFDLGDGLDDPPSKFSIHTYYPWFPYPMALAIRTLYYRIVGQPRLPPWLDKGSPSGPSAPPANGS